MITPVNRALTTDNLRHTVERLHILGHLTQPEANALLDSLEHTNPAGITQTLIAADAAADRFVEALIALAVIEGRPDSVIETIIRRVISEVRAQAERELAGVLCTQN